ncbi:hypothetical protein BJX63DRAFT_429337 [Aspergillus granulosus]|uniref:Secreted protein n=1 Tax=Aspergillus granulosus TaxID=176169 RepID=A0ABR4HR90_9EURO
MRKLLIIASSLWLSSGLAFDFEEFANPVSPAFNLAVSPDDDIEFQPYSGSDADFDIWDPALADSSVTTSSLLGEMDPWEEGDGEDRDILERQIRTCPPGTYRYVPEW